MAGTCVVLAGWMWATAFVLVGVGYELHAYGDGAIFAYAVAVQEAWTYHWHNISGRMFVYLWANWPAEAYVGLTGDARGGLALHGLLFFVAQLVSLGLTRAADKSRGGVLFRFACGSTVLLCPLVFGFPTEMWFAHAAFWPALALCHYGPGGARGVAALTLAFVALVMSHGGGVVLAATAFATVLLRDGRADGRIGRAGASLALALATLVVVLSVFRPDPYIGRVIATAAYSFIDVRNLLAPAFLELTVAMLGYAAAVALVGRWNGRAIAALPLLVVIAGLLVYWIGYDRHLLAEERYPLRTALLLGTPVLGGLAAAVALDAEGALRPMWRLADNVLRLVKSVFTRRRIVDLVVIVSLVHVVETAKFVTVWHHYELALRDLAMGELSDPALGDARFVSADRLAAGLQRLAWTSTTPFLSVLVAPKFRPRRLVVHADAGYHWLDCRTATASAAVRRAIPAASRELIKAEACRN